MDFPHGEWVTIVSTTTTTDEYGDTTTTSTSAEWGPCAVAPRYATESSDPRVAPIVVGLSVYGPELWDVTIDADDLLVIRDEEWQVDGDPATWRSPFTGWAPGLEVNVKRAG